MRKIILYALMVFLVVSLISIASVLSFNAGIDSVEKCIISNEFANTYLIGCQSVGLGGEPYTICKQKIFMEGET